MEGDLLVYQQEEVHTIPTSEEELSVSGKLRIIERRNGAVVEWNCSEEETNPDSDWAVVNASAVTFTHHNTSDSVEISTPRRHVRPISVELVDLRSYKLSESGSLVLIQRDGSTHPALQFPGKDAEYFVEVLQRYVAVKQSEKDPTLYLLQDKGQAEQDAKLSALNLVPASGSGSRRRRLLQQNRQKARPANMDGHASNDRSGRDIPGRAGAGEYPPHQGQYGAAGALVPWANTPQRVMGFLHNFKRDPYTTTLSTLSKFYDTVLYYEWEDGPPSERDEEENPFSSLNGFDDLEPGFQVVSLKGELAERCKVERLSALAQNEYCFYCDVEGRVTQPILLRQRIFRGGIHPSLRNELWCCLLSYYDWGASSAERELRKLERQVEYDIIKQQWKSISLEQESRFSGFRDRKSLIEKDVNRTDRSHPFYEGEDNPNIDLLHNILMSYVMYNFDLGYVQGMSDLLAPILYVTQNESAAFWCFVGYIDMVYRNFDMDQSGMKEQLHALQQIIAVVDPEFMGYLESKESANLYFCFRWLLVRYKRELSYSDTLRLWEVLWAGEPCPNFHLLVAAAILDHERNTIMENKFGFTEILKHINDTSQRLNLEEIMSTAEAIYHQLAASPNVPPSILELLALPVPQKNEEVSVMATEGREPALNATPPQTNTAATARCTRSLGECASSKVVIVSNYSTRGTAEASAQENGQDGSNREDFVLFRRNEYTGYPEDIDSDEECQGSSKSAATKNNSQRATNTGSSSQNKGRSDGSSYSSSSSNSYNNIGSRDGSSSRVAGDVTNDRSNVSNRSGGLVGTVATMIGSAVRHIAGDELTNDLFSPLVALQAENLFEDGLGHQFI